MIVDFATLSAGKTYRFLISAVVPRPIAFVSTISSDGRPNVAPFSYFMGVGSRPPTLAVSIGRRANDPKDTAQNIFDTAEFVVNVSTEDIAKQVTKASADFVPDVDEFEVTGLTPAASERVRPPRVAESPVNLECRLYRSMEIGEAPTITHLIVGEIVLAHVRDDLWEDAMIQVDRLRPVARLGANLYTTLGRVFAQDRPAVDQSGRKIREGGEQAPKPRT